MTRPTFGTVSLRLLALAMLAVLPAAAQELELKTVEVAPPQELAESIRAALDNNSVQLATGDKTVMEFWFRKDIPLRIGATAGEDALKALQEGTLVGAVRINETQRDFRDDRINPGLYTLRFALQPQDGDHMGTSPVPYFVLLSEAAADKDIEGPKDHEAVVKLSQTKNHPPNLNLRAVDSADGEFPRTAEGFDDTKILEVKLTAKAEGAAESTPLVLGVVYEGHGEV